MGLNRFLTTLTGSFLSRTGPPILTGSLLSRIAEPDWAADPDRFIAEPDWFVDVSDRVIISPGFITWYSFAFFIFAEEAQYNLVWNVQN